MKIEISTQILSGNLGDGWTDDVAAAEALADYTRKKWESDISELIDAGHTVEFDIEVQRATGCGRDLNVDCTAEDSDPVDEYGDKCEYEFMRRVESLLTRETEIWEQFCDPEISGSYQTN